MMFMHCPRALLLALSIPLAALVMTGCSAADADDADAGAEVERSPRWATTADVAPPESRSDAPSPQDALSGPDDNVATADRVADTSDEPTPSDAAFEGGPDPAEVVEDVAPADTGTTSDTLLVPDAGGSADEDAPSDAEDVSPPPQDLSLARDISQISLESSQTESVFGQTWEIRYFRNAAYQCGVSGDYTFLVIEPKNTPDGEAPLWVFLHGGGVGYFDDDGGYQTMKTDNGAPVNNSEESLQGLLQDRVLSQVLQGANQLKNTTLRKRLEGGYRLLVPALCDHDLYSGRGTPYPNNPSQGSEVNGLQATMAAIDYVAANYPTTHVFTHGQSAGSAGAWSVTYQYYLEGVALTGVVMDAYLITNRLLPIFEAFTGQAGFPFGATFELQGVIDKVGAFVDPSSPEFPEPELAVANGFDAVPILDIVGDGDAFCGGNQGLINEASGGGFDNNCDWLHAGLTEAITAQDASPHQVSLIAGGGHVVTSVNDGPAIPVVETFLEGVLATTPALPFE